MAEIINLRQARKKQTRCKKEQLAADNRVRYGLTKAEKAAAKRAQDDAARNVDGHKLSNDKPDDS